MKDELNFALAIVRELRIMDKEDDAWKTVFDLQKKYALKKKELSNFQARKRQKREEEKNNGSIFDNFLRSVSSNYNMPPSAPVLSVSYTSSDTTPDSDTTGPNQEE